MENNNVVRGYDIRVIISDAIAVGKEPSKRHMQLLLAAIKGRRSFDVSDCNDIERLLDINRLPQAEFLGVELYSDDLVFLPGGELIVVGDICDQEKIGAWEFWSEYIAPLENAEA